MGRISSALSLQCLVTDDPSSLHTRAPITSQLTAEYLTLTCAACASQVEATSRGEVWQQVWSQADRSLEERMETISLEIKDKQVQGRLHERWPC